jgi:hypothetical protein
METKKYTSALKAPLAGEEEGIDRELYTGLPEEFAGSPEQFVEEEKSDGSASAFEGTEIPREYDERDLSDKDLDDLLADNA